MQKGTTSMNIHERPERDNTTADATGETTGENEMLPVVVPGIVLAENESNKKRKRKKKGSAKVGRRRKNSKSPQRPCDLRRTAPPLLQTSKIEAMEKNV